MWERVVGTIVRGLLRIVTPDAEIRDTTFGQTVEDEFIGVVARRFGIYLLGGFSVWIFTVAGEIPTLTTEVWGRILIVAGAVILAWSAIVGPVRIAMVSQTNWDGNPALARSLTRRAVDGVVGIVVMSSGHVLLL
jgi:hypothetical protein